MYDERELFIGNILSSRRYGDFEIIELNGSRFNKIRFVATGRVYTKQRRAILTGEVADPYYPRVCGVGWLGIGKWKSRVNGISTVHYKAWRAMLNRCYSKNYHARDRYDKTVNSVCSEWLDYQNFAEWYDKEMNKLPEGVYELDKDLKGGKVYSPKNCILLPHRLNTAMIFSSNKREGGMRYPAGVRKAKDSSKYSAAVSISGLKNNTSGNKNHRIVCGHDTPEEAHKTYLKLKSDYIKDITIECIEDGTFNRDNAYLIENYVMINFGVEIFI